MKREFSFVIGEGKDKLSSLNELNKQKCRILESDEIGVFLGEPQIFEPTKEGEMWFVYQQYTYMCEGKTPKVEDRMYEKAEGIVAGSGKNFFLCCCDLNNNIRLKREVLKNVEIIGVPQFTRPSAFEKLWKATQQYTYEPQYY